MKGAIFTVVLAVSGVVAGLCAPFYGFLAYVCLAIVQPTSMWPWSVPPGSRHSFLVGLAMLLGWAGTGFGIWRFGKAKAAVAVLFTYWAWLGISGVQGLDLGRSKEIVIFYAKIILPFLVGLTTIKTMKQVRLLAWVIVVSQGYVAYELNLSFYSGYNRVWEEGFAGMDNNTVAIAMVTGVGLAFFLGMGTDNLWLKLLAFGSAVLMAHVILFSYSRGGMLSLLVTGLVSFVLLPKQPRHYLAFAIAVALMFRLAGPDVRERFATAFESSEASGLEASAQSRLDLWRDASHATMRYPFMGVGPDCWGLIAAEYGWPEGKEAHSYWMQSAVELGIPGVLILLSFYLVCIGKLWPYTSEKKPVQDPWSHDCARMVIAALIGFCFSSQFVTIKFMEVQFYVALVGLMMLKMETVRQPGTVYLWAGAPAVRHRAVRGAGS